MYEHFEQRFPEHQAVLKVLARLNGGLRAILADYEEINTWLAAEESPVSRDPIELERAKKLVRDLENEILNQLEKQDERIS